MWPDTATDVLTNVQISLANMCPDCNVAQRTDPDPGGRHLSRGYACGCFESRLGGAGRSRRRPGSFHVKY